MSDLAEKVAKAIETADGPSVSGLHFDWSLEARAAIKAVAEWLYARDEQDSIVVGILLDAQLEAKP